MTRPVANHNRFQNYALPATTPSPIQTCKVHSPSVCAARQAVLKVTVLSDNVAEGELLIGIIGNRCVLGGMNDEQESSHSVGPIAISFLVARADYAIHPAPGRQTCA